MSAPPAFTINSLLEKMSNTDSDFRFMSLNDLHSMLTSSQPNISFQACDAGTMTKLTDAIVKALDDSHGEVQNLAVKCLGPLVLKIKETQIAPLIDRLTTLSMSASDPSIPSTALRTIICNLPRPPSMTSPGSVASPSIRRPSGPSPAPQRAGEPSVQAINASIQAVQKNLLPKLMIMLKPVSDTKGKSTASGATATLDSVDLLVETVRCFGQILSGAEVERLQVAVMTLLESDRTSGVLKKRAVIALSLLCVHAPDELLSSFINHLVESFRAESKHRNPTKLRLLISVTGSLAKGIPGRFGPYLKMICPFVLSVVDGKDLESRELGDEPDMEMDEVREAALIALENFQSCCTEEMKPFTDDLINAGSLFIKYDPNYADPGDDDDEEMGNTQANDDDDEDDDGEFGDDDEDGTFDDDGNFSDEDDISWKVRRCATKLLSTVITTRAGDLIRGASEGGGLAYKRVAPLLVDRFHEREENVRLEVLSTATVLVTKTGEVAEGVITPSAGFSSVGTMGPPPKKTRRGSDASMMDTEQAPELPLQDLQGVRDSLSRLVPKLSKSLGKLLNNKSITLPTKQASVTLLSAVISVLHGGFEQSLSIFIGALIDAAGGGNALASGGNVVVASAPGGSAATATATSVRIEVLRLFSKIFENHSVRSLSPYLKDSVPAICAAVKEVGYKLSYEALNTVISVIRLLTLPDAPEGHRLLSQLYEVVIKKVENAETDLDVREKAIMALGVLLSRSSIKPGAISTETRVGAFEILLERLKNETTRISAARAIDVIAKTATDADHIEDQWVQRTVTELGTQLRKSNRALRTASLDTLRSISANDSLRRKMSLDTKSELVSELTPLLGSIGDMQLLALAISTLRFMVLGPNGISMNSTLISCICTLVKSQLGSGVVLENLLGLVATVGEQDVDGKKDLMTSLLMNVGVTGNTDVVAKVVAQLLVHGGGDNGGFGVGVQSFVEEAKAISDENRKELALMILGEIGLRMGPKFPVAPEMFLNHLKDGSENVPISAAIALGLAGAGNVGKFVPAIMGPLSKGEDSYLLVHSLKEIITHSSADSLREIVTHSSADSPKSESYIEAMWRILLSDAVANDDSKAVAAECVGRLIILDPRSFLQPASLPALQVHMRSKNSVVRGIVISALRYTFTDTDTAYDELLRPSVVEFLETMLQDSVLENRRLALTALSSAATHKPHLLAGAGLDRLLPRVYEASEIKPELIREIVMGPFRHRVDDGLEVRKSAYETLYSLLETSFHCLDMETYFQRVIAGITDEQDIRALANLMLAKLAILAKEHTVRRLDDISEAMRKVLSEKPKENAVKQELERHAESVRGIVKVAAAIHRDTSRTSASGQKWQQFFEWMASNHKEVLAEVVDETA
ncbi:armadillo-type protein [Pyronema domesticum]|uniref:Similar to Cullin-associated NEDD8-dissociated protein 1 acc. no. Q5R6L5 n=1 Tax=Pyronema omphalodes (strain CBS 100304) TaxID=1076935 RepID=U4LQH8_PYROM|nr:armadillo-type protein [Pyronema domesticum]CCX34426.1 Similar to Cullin-associated NEDD8-dissociated protein 1; acc. no. Q5R6L5 [Pyronema omphalodes CBS 100304]